MNTLYRLMKEAGFVEQNDLLVRFEDDHAFLSFKKSEIGQHTSGYVKGYFTAIREDGSLWADAIDADIDPYADEEKLRLTQHDDW